MANLISKSDLTPFPIFRGINSKLLEHVARNAVRRKLSAQSTLFSKGDSVKGFGLIVSGRVQVFCESMDGRHHILNFFEAGESFAEAALFQEAYSVTARTLTKAEIIWVSQIDVHALLASNPELALRLVAVLGEGVENLVSTVEDLTLRGARGRLCHYLDRSFAECPSELADSVRIPVSQHKLARSLGVTAETLSRTIRSLRNDGIISPTIKGCFTITDRTALRAAYAI